MAPVRLLDAMPTLYPAGHLPASRGPASLAGFRKGLRDSGFIEGQNVAMIE
jgi:hypothetical protein